MSIQGFKINGDEPVHYDYNFLDNKPIFYATYGETSFEEVWNVYSNGNDNIILCNYTSDQFGPLTCYLGYAGEDDEIQFYAIIGLYRVEIYLNPPSNWSSSVETIINPIKQISYGTGTYASIAQNFNRDAFFCYHNNRYYYLTQKDSNNKYIFVSVDTNKIYLISCDENNNWNESEASNVNNVYFNFTIDVTDEQNPTVLFAGTDINTIINTCNNGKNVLAKIALFGDTPIVLGRLSMIFSDAGGKSVKFSGARYYDDYQIVLSGENSGTIGDVWSCRFEPILAAPNELPQPIGAEASIGTSIFKYATQDHVHALPSVLVDALMMLASNIVYTNETVAGDCYYTLASALGINPLTRPDDLTITPISGGVTIDPPRTLPIVTQ